MTRKYSSAKKKVLRRRKLAFDTAIITEVEEKGEGTGKGVGKHRVRMATVASYNPLSGSLASRSPLLGIAKAINHALDPNRTPKPVKTLADMTPEERDEMERLYGNGPKKSKE